MKRLRLVKKPLPTRSLPTRQRRRPAMMPGARLPRMPNVPPLRSPRMPNVPPARPQRTPEAPLLSPMTDGLTPQVVLLHHDICQLPPPEPVRRDGCRRSGLARAGALAVDDGVLNGIATACPRPGKTNTFLYRALVCLPKGVKDIAFSDAAILQATLQDRFMISVSTGGSV